MKNIIKFIKDRLPISRKTYEYDQEQIRIVLNGITQSELQHSQMEMNLIKNINELKIFMKKKEKNKTKEKDMAFA